CGAITVGWRRRCRSSTCWGWARSGSRRRRRGSRCRSSVSTKMRLPLKWQSRRTWRELTALSALFVHVADDQLADGLADFGEGGGFDHPVADGAFDLHGRQHALRDGEDLIDVGEERELEGGKRASAADDVA